MKIGLPLPNEEKQVFVSKEVVHKLPVPFCNAGVFKMSFTQSDIDYIENTIKMHGLYRTVCENHKQPSTNSRSMVALAQFYNQFVNDKKCPKNLKSFLNECVAYLNAGVQQSNTSKRAAEINFMMDSWARTCH